MDEQIKHHDTSVTCTSTTPEHGCPSSEDTALFFHSLASESHIENEDSASDCGAVASCSQSLEGDAKETSSSWTWESRLIRKVNSHQTHQEISSVMEGASATRCGVATECAVTIVKETAFFDKLLIKRLSGYMRPIIGISSSHGWLLVHFWEGESYAVDLGALSPGTNQDLACPGIKVAGGTPDNMHKWAIIHSVGTLLSDNSVLKVVYDALELSRELEKTAGLKIVRVFDVLEADRIIRSHSFDMPLEELLLVYGIVPYSSVDIGIGSQRIPVPDDLKDYCGKSQQQAVSSLRKMAKVYSRMIPFLYQSMLSIMSSPMLTELNQRSDATVQSPEESDYLYYPREGSMISGPEELPTHSLSYAAAVESMVKAENTTLQQVACLVGDTSSNARVTEHERAVTQKQTVTPKKHRDECEDEMQEQKQQDEKMESGEPNTGSQQGGNMDLHPVTSNNGKNKKKQNEQFDCVPKETIHSTAANTLQVKGKCFTEDVLTEQDPPHLMEGATSKIREAAGESAHMQSHISSKQQDKEQEPKHAHGSYSKEQAYCPQMNSAQTKIGNQPSPTATNRKEDQQGKNLDNSVRPQTTNHTTGAFVAVPATNPNQNQEKQQELLPECIQAASGGKKRKRRRKTKNVAKQSLPQQKSDKAEGFANPQRVCQKGLNQMPAQKSIPTSASGQANPQKQTSSSKSPGLAVVKEKNQPKVKDQNDFKPKESRGLGVTGPAKTKEQTNQSKSHLNSKENINSKEKGKTQVPQQVMQTNVQTKNTGVDKASVSAKAKEQSSSSKNLLSSGAANKKEQNQTSQPKVKNDKKPQKNSEIGASAPAKTKDQTSPSKNPHIPREVVKSKKKQKLQNDVNKASVSAKAKQQSSSSKSLPSPGAPSKKEQNQMPQPKVKNDNQPQINSEIGASGPARPSKNPNIPREAVKSKQKQKLQNDVESKNMSVISTSSPGKCQDQPPKQEKHQKKEQKNSEVKDSVKVDSKKKKMKESNEPALRNEKEQHSQEKQLPEKLPLPSPPPPPPTPPPSSPPEQLPRQEKPTNSHQQDEQQIQPIEEQNINAALNREMLSKHQNLDSENIQSEAATIQQQYYQPPHPRKENTNLQQQYHHAQNQKEQKTSMQQQQQNTSKMKQQMHHPQHQPILLQQQPQQLLQCTFLPDIHPPGNVEVGGSPLLQYQPVPMSVNQATGPVWRTPRNPVDTRVMPNPAPGVIPQIPAGVVLQAPAHPSQQGTPFLQWEQQLKRQVKTSPERKISTLPQWMKPMVLQFQEDNTPVFIHPLSEQASIPINPCNITDEEEDQFEDLLESDVTTFVKAFPENIQLALWKLSQENSTCSYVYLAELVMDVGRQPKARYLKSGYNSELTEKVLNHGELTKQDMEDILTDNSFVRTCNGQVMIMDTLHRLGLLKNAQGEIIGMTANVRHPLPGCLNPLYDVFNKNKSILVMGPTGVGKTTLLREAARVLSDSQRKSIFVIDTLSEIAGEGDIPHQSIGSARRLQVLESNLQHKVMKEAYQNHRPEIVIIDEISSPEEAEESLNMRLRGIQLIAGVQGQTISDILCNSDLSLVTGGIKESAIVGNQGGKTARFRTGPVVFDILIEMLDRDRWIIHWDFGSAIDALLPGGSRTVGVEERKVAKLEEDDSGLVSQPVLAVQMLAEYQIYNQ